MTACSSIIGKAYLSLDIFSILQIHIGCKLLSVNSLYVYAIATVVSLVSRQVLSCQHQRVLRGINSLQCRHPPNVHNEFILWINCEWCASFNSSWIIFRFPLNAFELLFSEFEFAPRRWLGGRSALAMVEPTPPRPAWLYIYTFILIWLLTLVLLALFAVVNMRFLFPSVSPRLA